MFIIDVAPSYRPILDKACGELWPTGSENIVTTGFALENSTITRRGCGPSRAPGLELVRNFHPVGPKNTIPSEVDTHNASGLYS